MNKILIALCISLVSGLAANNKNPAPDPCCKEKCCPCPKPPVCCECYVPSYYDLQCDAGVYLYGDFLYWYAKEDNISPCMTLRGNTGTVGTAADGITGSTGTSDLVSVNQLGTKWDPGFRAAIGYNFDHDGWDFEANYTWYHNKKRNVISIPGFQTVSGFGISAFFPGNGQLALIDPWINSSLENSFLFEKVSTLWKLEFNQADLELGRKFWLGKYTALRTYAGVRGAWIITRFNNLAYKLANDGTNHVNNFSDRFKNNIWGVGLLAGLQPEWHFCRGFILFANLDAALLWGKFKVRKNEDYSSFAANGGVQTIRYNNTSSNIFYKMQSVLDLEVGFRWEHTWCNRVRGALDIAWENHIWFDVNHRYQVLANNIGAGIGGISIVPITAYSELIGDLMMGGPVVRLRIDF